MRKLIKKLLAPVVREVLKERDEKRAIHVHIAKVVERVEVTALPSSDSSSLRIRPENLSHYAESEVLECVLTGLQNALQHLDEM
jgi:hypothetical protein